MKITAVGGYKAVGRNMTGVTVGGETVALDNGIRLDTLQMYDTEIDMLKKMNIEDLIRMDILPEMDRLKGVVAQIVSHGHLDHIGALAIHKPKVPVISTHYAASMIKKEFKDGNLYSLDYKDEFKISNNFSTELLEITHSIPQSSIVVLKTPEGNVVYASDFRFDNHSLIAAPDYESLRKLGKEGVKALIAESTQVMHEGKTMSEAIARAKLKDVFEFIGGRGLIAATTFSTHIERVQAIMDEVRKTGRTPLILGRSLSGQISLAKRFDLIDLPPNTRVFSSAKTITNALAEIKDKNRKDYFLLVTGHQGEPHSVLSRLVNGKFPFGFQKGDSVIFSARAIPTPVNIASRYVLETKLRRCGVNIFDNIHVSGHAAREDHRLLLDLLKPEHVIPCHGGMKMRGSYAELAAEEGYELNKNIHLLMNGRHVELL